MRWTALIGWGAALAALAAASLEARPQAGPAPAAQPQSPFTYEQVMIPMRDGARLQTVILRPRARAERLPILLQRTPYGVPAAAPASAV